MVCDYCGTDNELSVAQCASCGQAMDSAMWTTGHPHCREHPTRPAVAMCGLCRVPLCAECRITVGDADFCRSCAPTEDQTEDEIIEHIPLTNHVASHIASPLKRFTSAFIDIFILAFATMLLGGVFWVFTGVPPMSVLLSRNNPGSFELYVALAVILVVVYYVAFTMDDGQTPGKQLTHIAVVDSTGVPPTLSKSILRFLAAVVSIAPFGLGFLLVLVDRRHRAVHDILASTVVISLEDVDEL